MNSANLDSRLFRLEPIKPETIRLIDLKPARRAGAAQYSINSVSISRPPPYAAVSHRWDTWSSPVVVHLDGRPFHVSPNVALCLHHLKEQGKWRYVWVDCVCINQDDMRERSSQVAMMGEIYSKAHCVVIWLGVPERRLLAAFEAVQDAGRFSSEQYQAGKAEQLCRTMQHLVNLDYWRRTWIIQEVLLAHKLVLMAGEHAVPWATLRTAVDFVAPSDVSFDLQLPHRAALETSAAVGLIKYRAKNEGPRMRDLPYLFELLERHSASQCSDIRDKVYALLAIDRIGSRCNISPDYSRSAEEVLVTVLSSANAACEHDHHLCRSVEAAHFLQNLLQINGSDVELQKWLEQRVTVLPGVADALSFRYSDGTRDRIAFFRAYLDIESHIKKARKYTVDEEVGDIDRLRIWLRKAGAVRFPYQQLEQYLTYAMAVSDYVVDSPNYRSSCIGVAATSLEPRTESPSIAPSGLQSRVQSPTLPRIFVDHSGRIGIASWSARAGDVVASCSTHASEQEIHLVLRPGRSKPSVVGRAFYFEPVVSPTQRRAMQAGRWSSLDDSLEREAWRYCWI